MTVEQKPGKAATASEIRGIIGAADDSLVAGIAAVGATRDEVLAAHTWLTSDDYLHRALHHTLSGRAAQVLDILEAELPEPDRP
jgi:hypothetical protein